MDIYLEILIFHEEAEINHIWPSVRVTLDTYIASFVLCYCKDIRCKIYLVKTLSTNVEKDNHFLPEELFANLSVEIIDVENVPQEARNCTLPVLKSADLKTCVAGLAGVLRFAIKNLLQLSDNHFCKSILGYRGGCLAACSEVSIWTKFCEKDIQNAVQTILDKPNEGLATLNVPEELFLLEEHLGVPVRTHNLLKRKQDLFKKKPTQADETGLYSLIATSNLENVTKDCNNLELNHAYFAGIDRTLADFVMLPCIYLMLNSFQDRGIQISSKLPLVCSWYQRMLNDHQIKEATVNCKWNDIDFENNAISSNVEIILPNSTNASLYLRDPARNKVKIKHKEPTTVIDKLKEFGIGPNYSSCPSIMDEGLDWHSLPLTAHPAGGDLPMSRVDRKCQQVESMVTAVMDLAQPDDVIVDFCSGGGHVGILLAYYLPKCKIVMVENKEASLQRARDRSMTLELDNVFFYQCNLNHFNGNFNLAVTLHACGVATDLVLEKCLRQTAKFICCPCCYGSVHEVHHITYPRSRAFIDAEITAEEYVSLCHYADRTEVDTPSESQGKFCMGLIDTDRALYFQERNYQVQLCTLKPPDCTPKSNLLIGIPNEQQ